MSEVIERPAAPSPAYETSPQLNDGSYPWERPWWKPAPGSWSVFGWIILIHVTAIVGLILFPLPGWKIALGSVLVAWIGGFGTTVCYHRTLAHRAVKLNPVVRQILTFFAVLNGSGTPLSWTANHRHHHARADTLDDISSPFPGGFWWSHLRWLWQGPRISRERYCRDMRGFGFQAWERLQVPVLALSYFGGLAFGWAGFFWFGALRLVYSLHAQCCVNSVCHLDDNAASGEDTSKNVRWLGIVHLLQGENWHRNHHRRPASARLGWNWRQPDLGWWLIVLLEKLHLASNVRRPEASLTE